MSEVIIICGAPASGKSTYTKDLVDKGFTSLNRDTEGGTIADLLLKMKAMLLNKSILEKDKKIILDNLFPTINSRKPFIEMAKQCGATVSCIWISTTIEDATFNFVQRAISILGEFPTLEAIKKAKHPNIFPPAVMFKYKKEFEKPTVEEGFNSVTVHKFERKIDSSFTNRAIILDYDGTVRECIGGNGKYPVSEDQIQIKPNILKTLQKYKDEGYLLLGMSNQSGIHKGDLTLEKAHQLFQHTNKLIGIDIEYNFCPHQSAPISCFCRKPMSGKFVEMMLKYKLDPKQCKMVGDFTSDATFAKRSGIEYVDQADFFK